MRVGFSVLWSLSLALSRWASWQSAGHFSVTDFILSPSPFGAHLHKFDNRCLVNCLCFDSVLRPLRRALQTAFRLAFKVLSILPRDGKVPRPTYRKQILEGIMRKRSMWPGQTRSSCISAPSARPRTQTPRSKVAPSTFIRGSFFFPFFIYSFSSFSSFLSFRGSLPKCKKKKVLFYWYFFCKGEELFI